MSVIEHLYSRWGNDSKMNIYLRPVTVFSSSKFDGYLNAAKKADGLIKVVDIHGNRRVVSPGTLRDAAPGYFKILRDDG